jgi:hypothetical protein
MGRAATVQSYEERQVVFKPTGRPEPSREIFPIFSKYGGDLPSRTDVNF